MAEAVERFLGIKGGRLESIDTRQRSQLAERLQLRVVATGSKDTPSYLVIDGGEGQTPESFPDTFLSLNKSNKLRIPFVQGKFNAGGTGVLQFCGTRNYQLITSRRHPQAPRKAADATANAWGFTIVRRMPPSKGRRSSMYVYLAPGGHILNFAASGVNVLPDGDGRQNKPPTPYKRPIEYGTCVKLYNYRWKAKAMATTEARYELERCLQLPCLPIRVTETRDYQANYYSTTIAGVWATMRTESSDDANVEPGFPAYAGLNVPNVGRLPYQIAVFTHDVKSRHVPNGVFFTVNGQVHGRLPLDFTRTHLKFDYLSGHLLVSVDCTNMEGLIREDFFMASRDRIRQNEVYEQVVDQLEDDLKSHQGLSALNAARRRKEIEQALATERTSVEAFQHLLRSDPTLSNLFSAGVQLVTSTGPGEPLEFKGRRFPTYFRIAKEPDDGLVKHCPINHTSRVEFETDAENDYFARIDSPGSITFEPDICQSWHLWNGRMAGRFRPPDDAKAGEKVRIRTIVDDVESELRGGPFVSKFQMIVDKPLDKQPAPGGPPRPRGSAGQDGGSAPRLSVPQIIEIRKDQWNSDDPPYTAFVALRVKRNGDNGYDLYLNVDNAFLLTELTRTRDDEKELVRYWFKYGLALCALGMLQHLRMASDQDTKANETGNGNVVDSVEIVNQAMAGLARVIVPIVRRLYRGPG